MLKSRLKLQKDHHERHATWLEAFYDLVFVFIINTLIYNLEQHPQFSGVGLFLLLMLPAWWLWVDFSYYFDQFGDDDFITRLCLFLSMLLILYMGLIVLDIVRNAQYFNIVYGLQRLLITFLYLRAYKYVPEARSTTKKFSLSFMISLGLWAIALFFTGPVKFTLWGIALAVEILNGPIVYATTKSPPGFKSHMPERFGIFLIIILGETILTVASGLKHVPLAPVSVITSCLSFLIAINVWWLYFSRINDERITKALLQGSKKTLLGSYVYGYGHFFIYSGIGIIGSGILLCFDTPHDLALPHNSRIVLCCGMLIYLTALYIVQRASNRVFTSLYTVLNIILIALFSGLIVWATALLPNTLLAIAATALSMLSLYVWAQASLLQADRS
jgi:low temperature requirement protein LtrA